MRGDDGELRGDDGGSGPPLHSLRYETQSCIAHAPRSFRTVVRTDGGSVRCPPVNTLADARASIYVYTELRITELRITELRITELRIRGWPTAS